MFATEDGHTTSVLRILRRSVRVLALGRFVTSSLARRSMRVRGVAGLYIFVQVRVVGELCEISLVDVGEIAVFVASVVVLCP